ncbi:hypothetical protein M413DRAFT_448260 [Hebeloma cylindrosporum]|uniref:Oxidation resistance protein 1 n=1 Tax=Hebeloma cylindrosporum TaxID=76867 RepID=A0A0C2Y9P2_HEBCY|nr:hypothetical protein M413DRAFT_448260 [Hebeloma cylindrosporum h7]
MSTRTSTSHDLGSMDPSVHKQPSKEADIDKFATLFTPGTPRGSPTLGFTPLPEVQHNNASRQASHRRGASESSQKSDFGAFVSVSAFDDPLSADIFEDGGLQAPMVAIPTPTTATYPKDAQNTNSSLSFFDQFAQDAKQRLTSRRSVLLEELLKHEDDPLYFLKEELTTPIPPDTATAETLSTTHDHEFDIHQELDPDYFRPLPKLAPPLAVAVEEGTNATSPPHRDPGETLPDDKNSRSSGDPEFQLARSTSYQSLSESLSSIPPRWMSTLLRGGSGGQSPSSASPKPVLESIFGDHTSPSTSPTAHASLSHTHSRAASTPSQSRSFPRSQTLPSPSSSPSSTFLRHNPVFTHTSAFAPPPASPQSSMTLSHGASPFAPHVYIPPSGAPGFKGDSYTWDKGFSEELEEELAREGLPRHGANVKSRTAPVPTTRDEEKEQAEPVSPPSAIKGRLSGGWGSGFGFGFGSIRGSGNGKGKQVADARDVVSPVGSGPLDAGDAKSSMRRASPGHSNGSGSASSSRSRSRLEDDDLGGEHGRKLASLSSPGSDHNLRGRQVGMGDFIERITGDVKLLGRKPATTPILTPELAGRIRPQLPALSRLSKSWSLIYSLDQDGISLNTLYNRCEAHATHKPGPGEIARSNSAMLVVIQDANGAIFGVWLAEGIRLNKGSKGYFGGGESFLWKYAELTFKIFKCTGKNNYVAFCEPEYISFGGGYAFRFLSFVSPLTYWALLLFAWLQ